VDHHQGYPGHQGDTPPLLLNTGPLLLLNNCPTFPATTEYSQLFSSHLLNTGPPFHLPLDAEHSLHSLLNTWHPSLIKYGTFPGQLIE
jgi:hypothetical protein